MNKRMLVKDMKVGQLFTFSRHYKDITVWQKKGTRTISRINRDTKEVLATYYFKQDDFGYIE